MAVKGLNHTEGFNRFRFENLSERLQNVDVDIIHRSSHHGTLGIKTLPETGENGCYFQDELENLKELYLSTTFKRFFYSIWPFTQSLAELLFNLDKVADLLQTQLSKSSIEELPAYLQLVSVLARDSQDDFFRHFHTFFQILTEIIQKLAAGENIDGKKTNGPNPELVGKVFECMSFLIRYQTPSLLKDYDTLRKYYGPLLGNRTSYVREFSSQMFIILLRKLSTKQFKSHLRNVLRAIAVSCANKHFGQQLSEVTANLVLDLPIPRIEGEITSDDISIRAQDLLEGVALLIFSTTKGIKNCLHSKGAEILKASLSLMSPLSVQSIEEIMTLSNKEKRKRSTGIVQVSQLSDTNQKNILRMTVVDVFGHYCSGRIFVDAIGRLFRHCHPANMSDLWISMLDHLDGVKQSYEAFLCLSEPSLELTTALEISISFTVEIFDFALCHSNHRAISSVPLLSERIILTIYGFVRHFLESEVFIRSSASTHRVIFSDRLTSRIRTLCTSLWSSFSRNPIFSKLKLEFIDIILGKPLQMLPKNESNVSFSISTGVKTVLNELFPLLPRTEVRDLLLHPFFTAIASLQQREDKSWVRLFYEVLIYLADNREHVDQTLQIHPGHQDLQFSYPEFHTLLQSCLSLSQLTSSDLLSSSVQKYQMIYAWKCLCWVISFEPDICLKSDILESIQELASSLTTTILPTLISQSHLSQSHHVLLSTALDTACSICTLFINSNTESVVLIGEALKSQLVDQFLGDLVNLLCTASPTLLLLWCFRRLLSFIICPFHDLLDGEESQRHRLISFLTQKQQEGLFNTLSYGLLNPSYWMRRESLQILLYFPPPAVIQNQSQSVNEHERDLDDEFELSERIVCDVVKLCYEAVSLEVCFKNEREFSRRLAQLEVFINSSSLPSEYSRVVSSFCLGILFVKFQPLWSPAVKVLMSAVLSEESEAVTWPLILYVLNYLGQKHETTPQVTFDSSKVDPYQYFETINSGEAPIEINFAESPQFLYTFNRYNDAGIVQPDSRTDVQTAYDTVWDVFQKCPSITLRHSKVVVPMFVAFLKDQYYMKFSDDPELPTIYYSGLFNIPEISNRTETVKAPDLSIPVTKKRLILFLKVFAAVTSPKQLYHHQALYKFYTTILSKPDTTVAKLALDCLLTYKPPSLVPYQKSLKNFFDDSALRNELLIFDPSLSSQNQSGETAEKIELSDRTVLIPVMIRILYGRFVSKSKGSKSAREQGLARRNAVLSFLAKIPADELSTFVHLMVRGLVPNEKLLTFIENHKVNQSDYLSENWLSIWHSTLLDILHNDCSKDEYATIPHDRQIGFLFLLEQCIKIMGFNITPHVPIFNKVVISMLSSTLSTPENSPEEDSDEEENLSETESVEIPTYEPNSDSSQIRAMCLRRLSEMVDQYHTVVDFSYLLKDLWIDMNSLIESLPGTISGSITGSTRAPALLKLITSLVVHEPTIEIIASHEVIVKVLIRCIGSYRVAFSSLRLVLTSLLSFLEFKDGVTLLPHLELLIDSFAQRFLGYDPSTVDCEVKLSELKINPIGSIKEELQLLTAITTKMFVRSDIIVHPRRIANLSTLLLAMLRTYTNSKKTSIGEDWANNILIIYRTLLSRVHDVRPHVSFIARLFGPSSFPQSVFNLASVRATLVMVFEELSIHPSTAGLLTPSCLGIKKLTAFDRKSISARDFGECMPVFQSLSDEKNPTSEFPFTWDMILGPSQCTSLLECSLVQILVHECIRCMYDSEIAVRGSALSSLRTLVTMTAKWSGLIPSDDMNSSVITSSDIWLELIKTVVLPGIHRGIKFSPDNVKKGFVLLLNHILKTISKYCEVKDQETFHTDLLFLTNDDDPDQDFFENIVHIQIHRRSRVFLKLRSQLSQHPITIRSFSHILLPLATYPLFSDEYSKKEHAVLLQESSSLVGAISYYLTWSQYSYLLKGLFKRLQQDKVDKEKLLLSTICSILESFHFELTTTISSSSTLPEKSTSMELSEDVEPEAAVEGEAEAEAEPDESDHEIELNESSNQGSIPNKKQVVVDSIFKFIFPQVKSFLIKHGKDHTGNKTQTVRPLIAVALVKLLKRCEPPLISLERRNSIFINLVLNIVNTLRSKDSSARDMARDSLAKMVQTMGLESLKLVLNELNHGLRDGYQRHVRNYTVRSLLTTVLDNYTPPCDAMSILDVNSGNTLSISQENTTSIPTVPAFDECISLIMQFCLDEIAGSSFEDRNVEDVQRTVIREAKGNKANEIFELCGRCLLFRPSTALVNPQLSSVHSLITPLLELLRQSQGNDLATSGLIGRATEALLRASVGLSKNPSLKASELFLYLHSTLTPFVATLVKELKSKKGKYQQGGDGEDDDEVLSSYIPSYLREDSSDEEEAALYSKKPRTKGSNETKANIWLPSERKINLGQKEAIEKRDEERREMFAVQDGVSAPKLTGRNRYKRKIKEGNVMKDDPAFLAAVKFCLSLLLACLKQKRVDENDELVRSMATPFLPLFAQFLRISGNTGIVVLAMRCICGLLSWGLTVDPSFSRSIGKRMLDLMYRGGAVLSTDNDLVQTCLKGLSSLFLLYNKSKKDIDTFNPFNAKDDLIEAITGGAGAGAGAGGSGTSSTMIQSKKVHDKLPLDIDHIRTLLTLLTSSILEIASTYQNSAFQLIKIIVESKIVVPEMYDLMKALIEQVVLSHRKGVRDVAVSVVLSFLLNYPMGKKRLEAHIKQFIANCSYEYEEGRMAALNLIYDLCRALPVDVLDEYSLLIFLPMTVQIVNDNSSSCRSRAGEILTSLIRRCSLDLASQCWNYALQWLGISINENGLFSNYQAHCHNMNFRPLMRTGAQVASLLVMGRHDIVKRHAVKNILLMICAALHEFAYIENKKDEIQDDGGAGGGGGGVFPQSQVENEDGCSGGLEIWALLYHLLILMEKLTIQLPVIVEKSILTIQSEQLTPRFVIELIEESMLYPHAWVRAASCRLIHWYLLRRDPVALNFGTSISVDLEILQIPNALYHLARRLCLVLNSSVLLPSLLPPLTHCLVFVIRAMYYHPHLVSINTDLDPIDDIPNNEDPPAVTSSSSSSSLSSNWAIQRLRAIGADHKGNKRYNVIQIFLELVKAESSEFVTSHLPQFIEVCLRKKRDDSNGTTALVEVSAQLLQDLETKVGASTFIGAYSEVQMKMEKYKIERKRKVAAEAVHDPRSFALKKVEKSKMKQLSKKRKSQKYAVRNGSKRKSSSLAIFIADK